MAKHKQASRGEPFAKSFIPSGRSQLVIYAVGVDGHEGVVKIGRTTNWKSRRKSYARWNLSEVDAVKTERVYVLTEEWIDLIRVERALLSSCPFPLHYGAEWFRADFGDMCDFIESFLSQAGISYE